MDYIDFLVNDATSGVAELDKSNVTLDRWNSCIGHTFENCVPCCWHCNITKKQHNSRRFLEIKRLQMYGETHDIPNVIDKENKYIFHELKDQMRGGPSIVFHRNAVADKTHIQRVQFNGKEWEKQEQGGLVKSVCGEDANSLYPYVMMEDMPCGKLTLEKRTDLGVLEVVYTYGKIYGFLFL